MSAGVRCGALVAGLDPSNEQARQWLQDELSKAAYQDRRDPLTRLLEAVERFFSDLLSAGIGPSQALPSLVAGLVTALLIGLVLFSLRYVRRSVRVRDARPQQVLGSEPLTAAQYRTRASAALATGRYADAVLDGMRALARGAVERALLEDVPSLTAHEIADRLESVFPGRADELRWSAERFDAVAYGERPASRGDAERVLALEADLARTRPDLVAATR